MLSLHKMLKDPWDELSTLSVGSAYDLMRVAVKSYRLSLISNPFDGTSGSKIRPLLLLK